MPRWVDPQRLYDLIILAVQSGAPQIIPSDFVELRKAGKPGFNPVSVGPWSISGSCSQAVTVLLRSRDYRDRPKGFPPMSLEMEVECRHCEECLKKRAARWRYRARAECQNSERTWFGTLTFSPEAHVRNLYAARVAYARGGEAPPGMDHLPFDFDQLEESARFKRMEAVAYAEVQRFLKRLRKNTQAPLRFMCVCEKHQSGLPHYHMLVHELDASRPIRHRDLKAAWTVGFTKFSLVTTDAQMTYAAKYCSKSLARVQASDKYGTNRTASSAAREGFLKHFDPLLPAPSLTQGQNVSELPPTPT